MTRPALPWRRQRRPFRERYGARAAHLIGFALSLVIVGFAVRRLFDNLGDLPKVALWFGGALVAHDLVFLPLYSAADRVVARLGRWAVYVRAPALLCGLLFIVYLPLIVHQEGGNYVEATSLTENVYLGRWLIACAVLCGGAALAALLRLGRERRWPAAAHTALIRVATARPRRGRR